MNLRLDLTLAELAALSSAATADRRSRTNWVTTIVRRELIRLEAESDERSANDRTKAIRTTDVCTDPKPIRSPSVVAADGVAPPPWAEIPASAHNARTGAHTGSFMPRGGAQTHTPELDETGYHVGRPWEDGEGEAEQ